MNTFKFSLLTPKGKLFDSTIEFLVVPGLLGEAGVLAHHAPTVMALTSGMLTAKDAGGQHVFIVGAGILEINSQNEALVLVDFAEKSPTIEDAKNKLQTLVKAT